MDRYSHSHPFPPRTTSISDYMISMTKKPKPRKPRASDGRRSKSSSPHQKEIVTAPYVNESFAQSAEPHGPPQIDAFISSSSQVETPVIVQQAYTCEDPASSSSSRLPPPLYLIHPDANGPIELPPWVNEFRPRIPPLDPKRLELWESPIPKCDNITQAVLVTQALTQFHFAVCLADEDAGESEVRCRQNLAQICTQYMPAMLTLDIKKHHIVFFYHGRKQVRMGNMVWDAISEWEKEQRHLRYAGWHTSFAAESQNDWVSSEGHHDGCA